MLYSFMIGFSFGAVIMLTILVRKINGRLDETEYRVGLVVEFAKDFQNPFRTRKTS